MSALRIGIDLGATKCLVAWVDERGTIVHSERFPSPDDPHDFIEQAGAVIQQRPAASIGIGVPGFVDRQRLHILRCPNLPEYVDFPMAEALAARAGLPVVLENDANAAALAEARMGAGRGHSDQVFVILGSGVGGGIIVNDQLVRGEGYAGEIGHLTVDPDGPQCGCGRQGCWELYASGRALARLAGVERGELVQEALVTDESWAVDALAIYVERVAEGLADLVLILAPSVVVLGGGVSEIGARLSSGVHASLRQRIPAFVSAPEVVAAALGNQAGAIGAALAAG